MGCVWVCWICVVYLHLLYSHLYTPLTHTHLNLTHTHNTLLYYSYSIPGVGFVSVYDRSLFLQILEMGKVLADNGGVVVDKDKDIAAAPVDTASSSSSCSSSEEGIKVKTADLCKFLSEDAETTQVRMCVCASLLFSSLLFSSLLFSSLLFSSLLFSCVLLSSSTLPLLNSRTLSLTYMLLCLTNSFLPYITHTLIHPYTHNQHPPRFSLPPPLTRRRSGTRGLPSQTP